MASFTLLSALAALGAAVYILLEGVPAILLALMLAKRRLFSGGPSG